VAHMLYNVRIWMQDELVVCEMKYAKLGRLARL
jgi:hypothetical protein